MALNPSNGVSPTVIDLAGDNSAAVIAHAAEALDRGEIIGLPTETVYGLAALATDAGAVDRLWTLRTDEGSSGDARRLLAWHVPSAATILKAAPPRSAAQRLLIQRLAPGAVTFSIELTEAECEALCEQFGAARGVFEDGTQALLRCPAPLSTRRVLESASGPVVMVSLLVQGRLARTAQEASEALASESSLSNLVLHDGPPAMGKQSTLLRLERSGAFRVVREGAVEERYIHKQLTTTIVFICTGNTCRSPMAAAIAKDVISKLDTGGLNFVIRSAGISASEGSPAAIETVDALTRLGVPPAPHSSMRLSRDVLAQADVVYAMTHSQAEAARSLDRSIAGRIELLDPAGQDIPDPIGQGQQVYDETAVALQGAIQARLRGFLALDADAPDAPDAPDAIGPDSSLAEP